MAEPRIGARMTLDNSRFVAGLRGAQAKAQATGAAMQGSFRGIGAMFGVGALGVVTGGGIAMGIQRASAAMSNMLDLARKSGADFQRFQKISQAFRESGSSSEQFAAVIPKMIKALGEAKDGVATYADAFAQMNINLDDFERAAPTEMILQMADAWNKGAKSSQDFAAMTAIMGRSAADMRQSLDIGREGIEAIGNSITVATEQSVERIKKVEATLIKFKQSRDAFVAETLIGGGGDVMSGLQNFSGFGNTSSAFNNGGSIYDVGRGFLDDLGAIPRGVAQNQVATANTGTLEMKRSQLGHALGSYNTAETNEDRLRLSAAIDRLRDTIAQDAARNAAAGGDTSQEPIFETHYH
jgi:hypothetical protein